VVVLLEFMRIFAPFLLLLLSNNLAKASPFTISFSGFSGCAPQSVTTAGFTFADARPGGCSVLFLASGPDFTGETMLDDNNFSGGPGPGVLITPNAGLFSALDLDISFVFQTGNQPGNVTIVGTHPDTTTVSQSFFLNSFGDGPANHYAFNSSFTNLKSLQMPPNTATGVGFFQFGNLVVDVQAAPEPGSWWLVLLGLSVIPWRGARRSLVTNHFGIR
jgi:hypothetical protein